MEGGVVSNFWDDAEIISIYRLTTSGGDMQEFTSLEHLLTEAKRYLDPHRLGASSVTIERFEAAQIDGSGALLTDVDGHTYTVEEHNALIDGSGSGES
jgi:hypothetical protein